MNRTYTVLMTTIRAIEAIATDPEVRGGRPYLLGTTVTVADVAIARLYQGLDVEGIADWYGLSLPLAYAALAYYYEHKSEIDVQVRAQIRKAEALKEQLGGSTDSLLPR